MALPGACPSTDAPSWPLGCWGRGWSRPQRMRGAGRPFPSLVLKHAAASALAPRRSSALECPREGSAEPSPWTGHSCAVRTGHSCAVQPKWEEASKRSAYGFAPSLCQEHSCMLYSSILFIAGSWVRVPQAEAKLLRAVHRTAASLGEAKRGDKASFKLPVSANLSNNGGSVGLK